MKTDMDNNLKKVWQDVKFNSSDDNNIENMIDSDRKTALQNLARRYRIFSNISLVMVFCSVSMANIRFLEPRFRVWLTLAFAVYFLIASVMDRWLYRGISSIDCAAMTVSNVVGKALFYRKRHLQFIVILLPMALCLAGILAWMLTEDVYMLLSIAGGIIAGLAIGLRQLLEFMSDYGRIVN